MEGDTDLQTMGGYVSLRTKEHSFSVFRATNEVKQKKAVPSMKDNRALIDEQLNLLKTIQGGKNRESVSGRVIQGRIPNFAELNALHEKLSVAVIREKVRILLRNLQLEGKVLQWQYIDPALNRLITDDGQVDRATYEQLFGKADGTEDKEKIYHKAEDASAKLLEAERESLNPTLEFACDIVRKVKSDTHNWVECVFGYRKYTALGNYEKISKKLNEVRGKMNEMATTDYNGDDSQVGVGGYANYKKQTIHFLQTMCGSDEASPITAIHECAHLVDKSIIDKGYVGSPGFCGMPEEDRVTNAAHYEIVPDWIVGLPCPYPVGNFSDGSSERESKVVKGKKEATDYFRYAHLIAFNKTVQLRDRYISKEEVDAGLKTYSEKMGLTIHLRDKKNVDLLDVTLAEDITRTLLLMYKEMKNDQEDIASNRFLLKSGFREYFKDKIIKANRREGITPENIEYLYSLAPKK